MDRWQRTVRRQQPPLSARQPLERQPGPERLPRGIRRGGARTEFPMGAIRQEVRENLRDRQGVTGLALIRKRSSPTYPLVS